MDSSDLLKKIRKIEIKAKGLSNHIFSGEYQTAFLLILSSLIFGILLIKIWKKIKVDVF